jgi:hypothetical protein
VWLEHTGHRGTSVGVLCSSGQLPVCSTCQMCADTGSTDRGCQGIISKQWELGNLGVACCVGSIASLIVIRR